VIKMVGILAILGAGMTAFFGALAFPPLSRHINYWANSVWSNAQMELSLTIEALRREIISEKEFFERMKKFGFSEEESRKILKATEYIPSPSDIIRFGVREAFRDDIARKYGYDEENPAELPDSRKYVEPLLRAQGMSPETFKYFWRAHWELPSPSQAFEFLHRLHPDQLKWKKKTLEFLNLTEKDVQTDLSDVSTLLKIADIPRPWRNRFLMVAYRPITRVDVRRFENLGLISKEELVYRYREIGYSPEDAEKLATFTLVYNETPRLVNEFRAGVITEKDIEKKLEDLGLDKEGIEYWKRRYLKKEKEKRLEKERDLTKSEILKGYQAGILSREKTIELLQRLGYSPEEAEFLVVLREITAKGDPEGEIEAEYLVELYEKVMKGKEPKIKREMVEIEREIKKLKKQRDEALAQGNEILASELNNRIASLEEQLKILLSATP